MATNTWTASSAGVWSNASNWSLGHVPLADEDVLFNDTGLGGFTLDANTPTVNTITVANTFAGTSWDDGGYKIDTVGTFEITLAGGGYVTMNGTVTIHGDGDYNIYGNMAGDYSDGHYLGAPVLDIRGNGSVRAQWYYYNPGIPTFGAYLASDFKNLIVAYPGKQNNVVCYGNFYSLETKGGICDCTNGWFIGFYLFDSSFSFINHPDTTWFIDTGNIYFAFTFRNSLPAVFNIPAINCPVGKIQFQYDYASEPVPVMGDIEVNFTGRVDAYLITAAQDMVTETLANTTYNTNGNTINLTGIRITNWSSLYRVKWFFGSSAINLLGYINTHTSQERYGSGRLQLYLESSVWTILGESTYSGDPCIWFVGWHNIDLFPGTSIVTMRPSLPDLQLATGVSEPNLGGYYAFNRLIIEDSTSGYINYCSGLDINVEKEFVWGSSQPVAWGHPGLRMMGSDSTITLNNDFHGRIFTNTADQTVTWNDHSGSKYVVDAFIPSDVGYGIGRVNWKSANPGTQYPVQFPANVVMGGLKLTDCTNPGSIVQVTKASSIDGGNNSGFTFVSSSAFADSTVADGSPIQSTLDSNLLVSLIQQQGVDPYFDTTSEIKQAIVYYTSADGRQFQYSRFEGSPLTGAFKWDPGATDGTWVKTKVVVLDANNAKATLTNTALETLTHSGGVMTLG